MPIYRYECTNPMCYHIDEDLRPYRLRDEPMVCTECGEASMRVVTAPLMTVIPGSWKSNMSAVGKNGFRFRPVHHPTREKT